MVLRDEEGNIIAAGAKEIAAHHHGEAVKQLRDRAEGKEPHFGSAPPVSPPAARTAQEEEEGGN
jgi:hypothetical protein